MTASDSDLDRLTNMLGQCLGRIDEQAFRIQQLGDEAGFGAADDLEDETAQLQELVASLLTANGSIQETDLNKTAESVATRCVAEIGTPVVLRLNLASNLPSIPYAPAIVAVAMQRAMMLAVDYLAPGGELMVTTRQQDGTSLIEIEGHGVEPFTRLNDRTETLQEFVQGFGGNCHTDTDQQHNVLVALELPQEPVIDRSESL